MAFYIIIGAYFLGVNIAGLVMLYIQKREKNLSPCERSFSDTNERTDTEKAALNYAAEHNLDVNAIGNNENYKNPTIPHIQENSQNNSVNNCNIQNNNNAASNNSPETNTSNQCSYTESGISCNLKIDIPIEETKREKKRKLKEQNRQNKLNKKPKDKTKKPVSNFTIIILAVLGGALFIYAGMFFMKYKLKNVGFMLALPTIIGLNIYFLIELFGLVLVWTAVNVPK